MEADISAQAERVKAVQAAAKRFTSDEQSEDIPCTYKNVVVVSSKLKHNWFSSLLGYKPCDPTLVEEKVDLLGRACGELSQLAADRRAQLDDSRRLWQFLWELGEEAAWIREQEQILSGGDYGKDLSSALHLLSKHEAFRDEMAARYGPLGNSIASGEAMVKEGHYGAPEVTERIKDVKAQWSHLEEVKHQRMAQTSKCNVSLSQSYTTFHILFFFTGLTVA